MTQKSYHEYKEYMLTRHTWVRELGLGWLDLAELVSEIIDRKKLFPIYVFINRKDRPTPSPAAVSTPEDLEEWLNKYCFKVYHTLDDIESFDECDYTPGKSRD